MIRAIGEQEASREVPFRTGCPVLQRARGKRAAARRGGEGSKNHFSGGRARLLFSPEAVERPISTGDHRRAACAQKEAVAKSLPRGLVIGNRAASFFFSRGPSPRGGRHRPLPRARRFPAVVTVALADLWRAIVIFAQLTLARPTVFPSPPSSLHPCFACPSPASILLRSSVSLPAPLRSVTLWPF